MRGNRDGAREVVRLRWGLVPSWAGAKVKTEAVSVAVPDCTPAVNARAESVADKPMFRDALRKRRCVILASGFYEWEHRGGARLPWVFRRTDGEPFLLAGLWDAWGGDVWESCTIITTAANAVMAPVHHRMPVMLDGGDVALWLDSRVTQASALRGLLRPWDDAMTSAMRVSARVNDVRFDAPECLCAPAPEDGVRARKGDGEEQMHFGF